MSYYRTCPECGCNLDPGEICDCKDNPPSFAGKNEVTEKCIAKMYPDLYTTSDALIIGYDRSKGLDMACLTIGRRNHDHIIIIKELFGTEAIKAYEDLTMGPCVKYDPHVEEFLKKSFNFPKN